MNSCGIQQNVAVSDRSTLICPKPRRSLRWQVSQELTDSNSRSGILDFILAKGGEQDSVFYAGSPPSRVSNPLTKDTLFKEELVSVGTPLTPRVTNMQPPPSPRSGGGCVRVTTNFGSNPAVRVVGFNCLDRDRRSSVSTVA